jgi:MPBQ/MSBQ methyltransferase
MTSINLPKHTRYQNAALELYLGVTESIYLHYGYWEKTPTSNDDLTLANFRIAQAAYIEHLASFIPAGVKHILDVGCGIGGNSIYLMDRGFTIEGLAPDRLQQQKYLQNTQGKSHFHLSRFEDFKSSTQYDLLLLSESAQYIDAKDIARGAVKLLAPNGYVLLSDMMLLDEDYQSGIYSNCRLLPELNLAMVDAGFELVRSEDISERVRPSLDLYVLIFKTFGLTTIDYVSNLVSIAVPPIHTILKRILSPIFSKLIAEGLDSNDIFDKHLCYQTQLWQLNDRQDRNSSINTTSASEV